jgi:hypothetical protein
MIIRVDYGPDWFTTLLSQAPSSHPSPDWPGCSDAALVSLVAVSKEPGRLEMVIGCLARQASSTFFTCARSRVPSRTHRTSLAPGTRANFTYPGSQVGGSFFSPAELGSMLSRNRQIKTLIKYNGRHLNTSGSLA